MKTCFVIQPFQPIFNSRYDDVFAPAIREAGLQPYRVDHDPSVSTPIDSIHDGIKNSAICLVDITLDKPNVWYELGYALASDKPVVLLCSTERGDTKYPFDVQHLNITSYTLAALANYEDLKTQIVARISALLKKRAELRQLVETPLKEVEGLQPHETTALVLIMENLDVPNGDVNPLAIQDDMQRAGFTKLAANLSIQTLLEKDFIEIEEIEGSFGSLPVLRLRPRGKKWLSDNQEKLQLRLPPPQPRVAKAPSPTFPKDDDFDDSDPFADE